MLLSRQIILSFVLMLGYGVTACSQAQTETDTPSAEQSETIESEDIIGDMNGDVLAKIIQKLDEDAVVNGNSVVFEIAEREMMMVYDNEANRMRVISPVIQVSALPDGVMERMLQANYDAVLDARYAIANDIVWSTFIHPLSSLTQNDFLSALAQTVTAAETFGTSYTSGAVVFGGGDSSGIHEDLLKELQDAAKARTDI